MVYWTFVATGNVYWDVRNKFRNRPIIWRFNANLNIIRAFHFFLVGTIFAFPHKHMGHGQKKKNYITTNLFFISSNSFFI